uniref:Uncharacterized protein n=1 Tax=Siphoviridae sp. ctGfF74 TaxID=2826223 RepID=A0A8S5NJM5_9CAUD|nr:MAG TPA: hypothetical protein [Siphoviridae sp. ctGfF74]
MPATIRLSRKVLPVFFITHFTRRCYQPAITGKGCAGNCIRFSTSRPLKACFYLRAHPEKGGNNKKRK